MSTHLVNKPFKLELDPKEYICNLRLTYDEFLSFEDIHVEEQQTRTGTWKLSSISLAIASMPQPPDEPMSYLVRLSSISDLYDEILPPKLVLSLDMYRNYCPATDHLFGYLKEQNLLLQGFNKSWQSLPFKPYGGLSSWIYIISGKLEIYLLPATKLNMLKYLTSEDFTTSELESFKTESETNLQLLEENNFLMIPAGYIFLIKATENTFVLRSEYLDEANLFQQLSQFENDTTDNDVYVGTRDRDIRYLYWFFAAKCLKNPNKSALMSCDDESLCKLRNVLMKWFHRENSSEKYVPAGLRAYRLTRALRDFAYRRSKRTNDTHCGDDSSPSIQDDMMED